MTNATLKAKVKAFWNNNETSEKDWEIWRKVGVEAPPPIGFRDMVLCMVIALAMAVTLLLII